MCMIHFHVEHWRKPFIACVCICVSSKHEQSLLFVLLLVLISLYYYHYHCNLFLSLVFDVLDLVLMLFYDVSFFKFSIRCLFSWFFPGRVSKNTMTENMSPAIGRWSWRASPVTPGPWTWPSAPWWTIPARTSSQKMRSGGDFGDLCDVRWCRGNRNISPRQKSSSAMGQQIQS